MGSSVKPMCELTPLVTPSSLMKENAVGGFSVSVSRDARAAGR